MYQLREYQSSIIKEVRDLMSRGNRSILIVSPTGSGKTLLTAYMLGNSARKGLRSWFSVHRRELIHQSSNTFKDMDIPHGIISPHYPSTNQQISIASIQTLSRRIHKLDLPDLMIWDEAHHLSAKSWDTIYRKMPNAFHVGLTATPVRLDGKGLKQWFPKMVQGPRVPWLIENGFLSPYKMYAPTSINMKGARTRMGDYMISDVEAIVNKPSITGNAVSHYRKFMDGKRAVVFCASVKHSKDVALAFNEVGIASRHVDGETPTAERDYAIRQFRDNELQVLCNVDLFGEGFDIPAMEGAILLRPTQSLGLYLQQCGRALRPYPGKEQAIILDHSGNCLRHGLPDEERDWSLEDRVRNPRSRSEGSGVRTCKKCYGAQPVASRVCKYCGFEFEIKSREIDEREGTLEEVIANNFKKVKRVEQGRSQTFNDLIELGKRRGYRFPYGWARAVFNARQRRRLGK